MGPSNSCALKAEALKAKDSPGLSSTAEAETPRHPRFSLLGGRALLLLLTFHCGLPQKAKQMCQEPHPGVFVQHGTPPTTDVFLTDVGGARQSF